MRKIIHLFNKKIFNICFISFLILYIYPLIYFVIFNKKDIYDSLGYFAFSDLLVFTIPGNIFVWLFFKTFILKNFINNETVPLIALAIISYIIGLVQWLLIFRIAYKHPKYNLVFLVFYIFYILGILYLNITPPLLTESNNYSF